MSVGRHKEVLVLVLVIGLIAKLIMIYSLEKRLLAIWSGCYYCYDCSSIWRVFWLGVVNSCI